VKKHLTIENGKRVTGMCRLSAVKRKDGQLIQRMTLTSVINDDHLGDTVLAGPLQAEHDRMITIRKGENQRVKALDVVATMPGELGRVHVWPLFDGAPGERYTPEAGLEGCIVKIRGTAGSKHAKQVAIVDVRGTADELGSLLDAQECEVMLRVQRVQGDLFDGEKDDDEDLPEEPDEGQLELGHLPADEQESARANLEPAEEKPARKKKSTGTVDVEVADA
jgi:hypothetical protein